MGPMTNGELWHEGERRRLVRLCTAVTGDRDAAEDLAQETLLEAWRHAHKLRDPAGADRWLSAVARNVCRRWARRRGRELALAAAVSEHCLDEAVDVEVELERAELADLLDGALALLPSPTRDVLVQRFVEDRALAEIAARLGVSEDAVAMRLTRGKLLLRRALAAAEDPDAGWVETRSWCSMCGRRRLLMQRDPGAVRMRCPDCDPDLSVPGSEFRLSNPGFARLLGDLLRPAAIIRHVDGWKRRYFGGGVGRGACMRCDRAVAIAQYDAGDRPPLARRGLYAVCAECGEGVSSSLAGLALAQPAVAEFRRAHPRLRAVPHREVERAGVAAVVVRYEDVRSAAGVDVAFARDTFAALDLTA